MLLIEKVEILEGTPGSAGFINLKNLCLPAPAVTDLPGKVNVSGMKDIIVNQSVKSTFANHKGVPVIGTYMIE